MASPSSLLLLWSLFDESVLSPKGGTALSVLLLMSHLEFAKGQRAPGVFFWRISFVMAARETGGGTCKFPLLPSPGGVSLFGRISSADGSMFAIQGVRRYCSKARSSDRREFRLSSLAVLVLGKGANVGRV